MAAKANAALLICLVTAGGCASWSTDARPTPGPVGTDLVDPDNQRRVLGRKYDRARLRREFGEPTIDDGEEWVYVGKCLDGWGMAAGMLFAVYGSMDNPAWKLVVVTFDRQGFVERVRVASADSSIAEYPPNRVLMGFFFRGNARVRAEPAPPATQPALGDTGRAAPTDRVLSASGFPGR